jgi:hypothetical protein
MRRVLSLGIAVSVILMVSASTRAEEPQELDSYLLLVDEFVTRKSDGGNEVFYAADPDILKAKLKEFGLDFPKGIQLPEDSLFVLVVSDFNGEAFKSLALLQEKGTLIVNLKKGKPADKPKAPPEGRKNSRLLLVGCPPVEGIKGFAIRTVDATYHKAKGTRLKAD